MLIRGSLLLQRETTENRRGHGRRTPATKLSSWRRSSTTTNTSPGDAE